MEAQIRRQDEEDRHNAGLHSVAEGEREGEHHKKSVLKKVKEKAKKIKDTVTKHGHGHGHGPSHEHGEEHHSTVQEESTEDPEIHGAPMYDSAVIRSRNLGPGVIPGQEGGDLEKSAIRGEHQQHQVPLAATEGITMGHGPGKARPDLGRHAVAEAGIHDFPHTTVGKGVGPLHVGFNEPDKGQSKVTIGQLTGLDKDQNVQSGTVPPSNYESKVTDPTRTGGKEADVGPLVHGFEKMGVGKRTEGKSEQHTGTHDQFAAEQHRGTHGQLAAHTTPTDETMTGKISSATAVIADKAMSAKNVVASKLGYGGGEQEYGPTKPASESAAEYAHKAAATVTETLAPVYEKVVDAGSAVMAKMHGGDKAGHEGMVQETDKGVSVTEYLTEKLKPGNEDKLLSEVISDALHKKEEGHQEKPMGKVTESEEVARRLGTGAENKREGEDALAAGRESSGDGVTDRLKDAVGSWLGKSAGVQSAWESLGQSHVSDPSSAAGEAGEHGRHAG